MMITEISTRTVSLRRILDTGSESIHFGTLRPGRIGKYEPVPDRRELEMPFAASFV